MTVSQHGRGTCRVCGGDYALKRDGTVRRHPRAGMECGGTGAEPDEVTR